MGSPGGRVPQPLWGIVVKFLFTVDVERDPFVKGGPRFQGVDEGLPRLLALLRKLRIQATMFVSGEVLRERPDLARRLVAEGHELGSHGFDHSLGYLSRRPRRIAYADILAGRDIFSAASGKPPVAFRAPNFGVDSFILRSVEDLGFRIDSSVLPGRRVRKWRAFTLVDHRGAPTLPYRPLRTDFRLPGGTGLIELPVTSLARSGSPIGLGLVNAIGPNEAWAQLVRLGSSYILFLSHPWEAIDLADHVPQAPAWVGIACRSDTSTLEALLARAVERGEFMTVEGFVNQWTRTEARQRPASATSAEASLA